MVLFIHVMPIASLIYRGASDYVTQTFNMKFLNKPNLMHFVYNLGGLELKNITFKLLNTDI